MASLMRLTVYFWKFTESKKGIVTSTIPLTGAKTTTKTIGGVAVPVREQIGGDGDVKFGFTAIDPKLAAQMQVNVGDELPLEITDKPVLGEDDAPVPNLFWAH